jgi:hypothetical protein
LPPPIDLLRVAFTTGELQRIETPGLELRRTDSLVRVDDESMFVVASGQLAKLTKP